MVTKDKYDADIKTIDLARHQSLLDYITPKTKISAIPLTNASKILDIAKDDFTRHFTDERLKDWKLTSDALVNYTLYKERMSFVDELVDEGLDNEDIKPLVKAVDYLSFMQKGLRFVEEYVEDLEDKKELINEDIADIRGILGLNSSMDMED